MHTQIRSGKQTLIGKWLPGMVAIGIALLTPDVLIAQSTRPAGPFVSKTKQAADQLVAVTQPGYYKALLIPDWRIKQQDRTLAVTVASALCSRARAQPVVSPTSQLSGVRLDEKQVQLTWGTSHEVTAYTIALERSISPTDGFETITSVESTSAAPQAVTHQTIDPNPYAGYSYYRLKRVESSGVQTYSQTVAVKGELRSLTVQAFPNPGQPQTIRFQVAGPSAPESVSVALYDVQGRLLYQHEQADLDASRRFGLPGTSELQPGLYFLKINTNDQHTATSFIVQP